MKKYLIIGTFFLAFLLSGCFLFHVLTPPRLIYPVDGAIEVPVDLVLKWAPSNISSYEVLLWNRDYKFSETVNSTNLKVENLFYSTRYNWEVVALKDGKRATSETWSFTTRSIPKPSTPALKVDSVSTSSITLEWNTSSFASTYVLRESTGDFYRTILQTVSTSAKVNNLNSSTTYDFYVIAKNTSGVATSNVVKATTLSLPKLILPSTPVLNVEKISTDEISIDIFNIKDASSVEMYMASSTVFKKMIDLKATCTSYTFSHLKPSTLYKFFAVSVNPNGRATSLIVSATTQTVLLPPSTPILKVDSLSASTVNVSWTPSRGASSIEIYKDASKIGEVSGKATSFAVRNLKENTFYTFFVVGINKSGRATSNTVEATTLKVVLKPSAPKLFVNSLNTYTVVLNWTESSTNIIGFHIWRRSNSNEAYTLLTTVKSRSYTDIVEPGKVYSYLVSAYNSAGQSFSKASSLFVGQNYFPMKTSTSLAVIDSSPSISSSEKIHGARALSLFKVVRASSHSANSLIPVNELLSYEKKMENGEIFYTIKISSAFRGSPNSFLLLSFVLKSGKVYIQNFASQPIQILDSVYGNVPSKLLSSGFSKIKSQTSEFYSEKTVYISSMKFGDHVYKNVLEVILKGPNLVLNLYFVPNEGLMKFDTFSGSSPTFSFTVSSTSANVPVSYPIAPIILTPSNESTLPSTFTLRFRGGSDFYTVYLNSDPLISTSSTVVKIGPLDNGTYTLTVKAKNNYGLESLSNSVNFTVEKEWTATPTYVVGDFTNWATMAKYEMKYDPLRRVYTLSTYIPSPSSTAIYGINRYMIEQICNGKIVKYGYKPIPVKSGKITFYFDQSMVKAFTSLGIGDTSKEDQNWYFTGDINGWKFSPMQASGTTFVATIITNGVFKPRTYKFKITPQAKFSTSPASLIPYYFNGSYGAYYLPNGSFSIATPSNEVIVKFNTLNSKIDFEATFVANVFLRDDSGSWFANVERRRFRYDPLTHVYSLKVYVPKGNSQEAYKVYYDGKLYPGVNVSKIPFEGGSTVTFYFDSSVASTVSAVGMGDTSKESMTWYFSSNINSWGAQKFTYVGNGLFVATFTGAFNKGQNIAYKIKNTTSWPSNYPYYFNGTDWYANGGSTNGNLVVPVTTNKIVIEFNVLKSLVSLQPVFSPTYYVAGNFDGWQDVVDNLKYKMTKNASGVYTLTTTLPSTLGQWQYKIVEWTGTGVIWYGGPSSNSNYGDIPVKSGTVTFYFTPTDNDDSSSAFGIGDTTKEKIKWYFASNLNNWKFATMTYIGKGIFAATLTRFATNDSAGVYEYKIAPQPVFSTNPASLTQYYFNGGYGGYYGANGSVIVPRATTIVIDFNVLNSSVSAKAAGVQKLHQVIMAFLDSLDEIHVMLNSSVNTSDLSQFTFVVNGNKIPISSVVDANIDSPGISNYITIKLSTPLNPSAVASNMILSIKGFATSVVYARYVLNNPDFHYNGQLGAIYTPYQTTFRVWSPVSNEVKLLLFREPDDIVPYVSYSMTKSSDGVWSVTVAGNLSGVYYDYSYHRYDKWVTAPDIYSKAANAENTKSMVVDLSQTDPDGWNSDVTPFPDNMVDAIIYEVHVQDFTDDPNSGISPQYRGTYMGFTQTGTTYDGVPTALDHLVQLGVNYVQLLPIEDYEDPINTGYNWGYVPYLYMVPEPKYSTTPNDPINTVNEVKHMIEALHSKGIGVILDVSFSHTSYVTIPYEAAVPYYYYNYDKYGQKTNYSGVGNDLKTSNYMVRKLVIDTLEYWMKEYHISGFRFDQMYLYDPVTIEDIVSSLTSVNPNVLLYGEPWPANGYEFTYGDQRGMHLGVFNGHFRDAIIGTTDNLTAMGFVNGNAWNPDIQNGIKAGIIGSVPYGDLPNTFASEPDETINYATCHDDYTLWDKIRGAKPTWGLPQDIAAQKLAGAIVMLSQGVAFMQGGAEFARTKGENGNSYNVKEPNEFDWSRLTKFATIDDYYRGLIAIRRSHPAFRITSCQEIDKDITFLTNLDKGVIGYEIKGSAVGDSWRTILVYFNANTAEEDIELPTGEWNMVVNGAISSTKPLGIFTGNVKLNPLSAYVFYK